VNTNEHLFNNASFDNKYQDFTCSLSSIGGNLPNNLKRQLAPPNQQEVEIVSSVDKTEVEPQPIEAEGKRKLKLITGDEKYPFRQPKESKGGDSSASTHEGLQCIDDVKEYVDKTEPLFESLKEIAILCNSQNHCLISTIKSHLDKVVEEIYEYLMIKGLNKEKLAVLEKTYANLG